MVNVTDDEGDCDSVDGDCDCDCDYGVHVCRGHHSSEVQQ